MKSITIEKDGKEFIFYCSARNTRNGFAHDCEMEYNHGFSEIRRSRFYLNRTWEYWRFQSVCLDCISELINRRIDAQKGLFLENNGYKRMTANRKEQFQQLISNDKYLDTLQAVKTDLQKNLY